MDTFSKLKEQYTKTELIWTTKHEFVSSYSVDECIHQLNRLRSKFQYKRPPFWNVAGFYFDDIDDKGEIVQFGIKADTGKIGVNAKVLGQLNYKDERKTVVKMTIGLTSGSIILTVLILAFINTLFIFTYHTSGLIAVLCMDLILLTLVTASCVDIKSTLRDTILETLESPEPDRPTTLPL